MNHVFTLTTITVHNEVSVETNYYVPNNRFKVPEQNSL